MFCVPPCQIRRSRWQTKRVSSRFLSSRFLLLVQTLATLSCSKMASSHRLQDRLLEGYGSACTFETAAGFRSESDMLARTTPVVWES